MNLPTGWGVGAIEMRLYDDFTNDLTLKATSDGGEPYVELLTTDLGVAIGRGDLQRLGDIADTMLNLFERMNSEAPAAGDKPATGITPTAE